ncbi:uncharacterized protein LOC112589826 [Harpegnathos saltator]|uniref:uncharacterized protein LOC112589238 n=1 Tax=Harpegnathos saltator TaxID=610380 RepID=UPI000DBED341|nr:uncharacterized protein LOC112589238 [Harpegnathos saltator]XP_025160304.1 uncharacterized protein LOC112589826 [Harpegnathos saltator]
MNNAVFGKTMENVRNHVDVKLLTKWDGRYGAEAMIARPNFHSRSVFSENLIAVELRKLEVKFNKPIYRYSPRIFAQHIDNSEYIVVASIESRVRTHLYQVSLPKIIVSAHYDASTGKISSRWSVQLLHQPMLFVTDELLL